MDINQCIWDTNSNTDINSGKLNITLIIFGWAWSKNEYDLLGHRALKSTVSQSLIYEVS